jgi:hypothetical protein
MGRIMDACMLTLPGGFSTASEVEDAAQHRADHLALLQNRMLILIEMEGKAATLFIALQRNE